MRKNFDSCYWRCLITAQNDWFWFCLNDPNQIRILLRWRDIRVRCNVRSSAIAWRSAFSSRAGSHNASSVGSVGRRRWGRWLQPIQKEQSKPVLLHTRLELNKSCLSSLFSMVFVDCGFLYVYNKFKDIKIYKFRRIHKNIQNIQNVIPYNF